MAYQPQPGTLPHRAIAHLQSLGDGAQISTLDLAAALDAPAVSLVQSLQAARGYELLVAERKPGGGRSLFWRLGDGVPQVETDAGDGDESAKFNAALWADGDLVIYGAQENDDGSVTLNAGQVAAVKRLIAWSAPA